MKSKEYKKFKEDLLAPLKKREREIYTILWQDWKTFFRSSVPLSFDHEDEKVIKSATRLALARFVVSICHHNKETGELRLPRFEHAVEFTEVIKLLGTPSEVIERLTQQECSIELILEEQSDTEPLTPLYTGTSISSAS